MKAAIKHIEDKKDLEFQETIIPSLSYHSKLVQQLFLCSYLNIQALKPTSRQVSLCYTVSYLICLPKQRISLFKRSMIVINFVPYLNSRVMHQQYINCIQLDSLGKRNQRIIFNGEIMNDKNTYLTNNELSQALKLALNLKLYSHVSIRPLSYVVCT